MVDDERAQAPDDAEVQGRGRPRSSEEDAAGEGRRSPRKAEETGDDAEGQGAHGLMPDPNTTKDATEGGVKFPRLAEDDAAGQGRGGPS